MQNYRVYELSILNYMETFFLIEYLCQYVQDFIDTSKKSIDAKSKKQVCALKNSAKRRPKRGYWRRKARA